MKISTHTLSKSFHDADRELVVINALSIEFPVSGSVGIVGRSGTGKSTLLHLLGGLERPSAGFVAYDGRNISDLPDGQISAFRGAHVGFIFQAHHLLNEFTAIENIAMPLLIAGETASAATQKARLFLDRVGLSSRGSHRPGQLSGGEQQRVSIARALIAEPQVVLADEPTGNLDQTTAREIQDLLVRVMREMKGLLIVVTHSLELARSLDCAFEMLPGGALRPFSN